MSEKNMVDEPTHYNVGINVIKYIDSWNLGFSLGNCVKYVTRAFHKHESPLEDLLKARWYLNHEIERLDPTKVESFELKTTKAQVSGLEDLVKELDDQICDFKVLVSNLDNEILDLRNKLKCSEECVSYLNQLKLDYREVMDESDQMILQLKQDLSSYKDEVKDLKNKLEEKNTLIKLCQEEIINLYSEKFNGYLKR